MTNNESALIQPRKHLCLLNFILKHWHDDNHAGLPVPPLQPFIGRRHLLRTSRNRLQWTQTNLRPPPFSTTQHESGSALQMGGLQQVQASKCHRQGKNRQLHLAQVQSDLLGKNGLPSNCQAQSQIELEAHLQKAWARLFNLWQCCRFFALDPGEVPVQVILVCMPLTLRCEYGESKNLACFHWMR